VDPRLRTTLATLAASLAAFYLGWQVAEGAYALPMLVAAGICAMVLVRLTGLPADTIFTGLLLVGYLVGNRGFAQFMPVPGVPLLPAEAGLLLAGSWRGIQCAFERRLPFRPDALNWAVLAWAVAGTARLPFDVPRYGFLALRDYATVYYAAFFFLVQDMAGESPAARRYLLGCLLAGLLALAPTFLLFQYFPEVFLTQLTFAQTPLIYLKGDLAVTFLAVGALLTFHWAADHRRLWTWPAAAGMLLLLFSGGNRASMLGALVAAGLLLLAGRWRFPAFLGAIGGGALLVLLCLALVTGNQWAERRLHSLADQARSVLDVSGERRYESEDSFNKGDNNRFRLLWWRNVVLETWETNPVFGLGFGADLARGFVQEYYADSAEEFTTRSPHNVFLTMFGRTGAVGLGLWLGLCGVLLTRTWRTLRESADPVQWSLACAPLVILASATFGVVLEGPMGAVVFWGVLGLAHAVPRHAEATPPVLAAAPAAAT
jgi:hypothetical protein